MNILEQLERLSINLFSDDKATRKEARASIIKQQNQFETKLTKKQQNTYPNYYLVSSAIHELMQEGTFAFKIHKEKAGTIQEVGKKQKPGKHTFLPARSKKRTYFALMPHLVGSHHSLKDQIDLLFQEGFGENTRESEQEAKSRLHLFVGMNYCHSIDKKVNREKKNKLEELWTNAELIHTNVSYTAFRWEPVWTRSDSNAVVPQSEVKRLFRLLKKIDNTKASRMYQKVMSDKVVPYQYIREEIKDGIPFTSVFKAFRKNNQNRPADLVTVDDDAVRLRTGWIGLFSQYDALHEKFPNLQVATTGYYMADPENYAVEFMSKANLAARKGLGILRANGAYLPEPNISVTIPKGFELSTNISYLRSGADKGKNLESIGLLENLGLMKGDVNGKVIFGTEGAIQTAVSPNVNIPKHLKENVTAQSFLLPKNLKSLRKFSQSAINPLNGFAANILRTYPTGTNTSAFKPAVAKIFTAFDPVEYAQSLQDCWLQTYLEVALKVNEYFIHTKDLKKASEKGASEVVKRCKVDVKNQNSIKDLLESKTQSLFEAQKTLVDSKKFTQNDVHILITTSMAVNGYVFGYFYAAINT